MVIFRVVIHILMLISLIDYRSIRHVSLKMFTFGGYILRDYFWKHPAELESIFMVG